MFVSVLFWIMLAFCVITLLTIILLITKFSKMMMQILQTNRNLLDRIQSQDLPTYQMMTHLTTMTQNPTLIQDSVSNSDLDYLDAEALAGSMYDEEYVNAQFDLTGGIDGR